MWYTIHVRKRAEVLRVLFAGVGLLTRKAGNLASPVVELTKVDDKYVLSSNSSFKNSSITFKIGEEFDEETLDGRKVKSTIIEDENKLFHTQKMTDDKVTVIVREFEPDQLKMVNNLQSPNRPIPIYRVNWSI